MQILDYRTSEALCGCSITRQTYNEHTDYYSVSVGKNCFLNRLGAIQYTMFLLIGWMVTETASDKNTGLQNPF